MPKPTPIPLVRPAALKQYTTTPLVDELRPFLRENRPSFSDSEIPAAPPPSEKPNNRNAFLDRMAAQRVEERPHIPYTIRDTVDFSNVEARVLASMQEDNAILADLPLLDARDDTYTIDSLAMLADPASVAHRNTQAVGRALRFSSMYGGGMVTGRISARDPNPNYQEQSIRSAEIMNRMERATQRQAEEEMTRVVFGDTYIAQTRQREEGSISAERLREQMRELSRSFTGVASSVRSFGAALEIEQRRERERRASAGWAADRPFANFSGMSGRYTVGVDLATTQDGDGETLEQRRSAAAMETTMSNFDPQQMSTLGHAVLDYFVMTNHKSLRLKSDVDIDRAQMEMRVVVDCRIPLRDLDNHLLRTTGYQGVEGSQIALAQIVNNRLHDEANDAELLKRLADAVNNNPAAKEALTVKQQATLTAVNKRVAEKGIQSAAGRAATDKALNMQPRPVQTKGRKLTIRKGGSKPKPLD
jgi:hypothetical protein